MVKQTQDKTVQEAVFTGPAVGSSSDKAAKHDSVQKNQPDQKQDPLRQGIKPAQDSVQKPSVYGDMVKQTQDKTVQEAVFTGPAVGSSSDKVTRQTTSYFNQSDQKSDPLQQGIKPARDSVQKPSVYNDIIKQKTEINKKVDATSITLDTFHNTIKKPKKGLDNLQENQKNGKEINNLFHQKKDFSNKQEKQKTDETVLLYSPNHNVKGKNADAQKIRKQKESNQRKQIEDLDKSLFGPDKDKKADKNNSFKLTDSQKGLVVNQDDISKLFFDGRHDAFHRSVFRAAFGSAMDDTDVNKGMRPVQSEKFKGVLRATNLLGAHYSIKKDVDILKKSLSEDDLNTLSKILSGGNYGVFDLKNTENYKESMLTLHYFMKDNGFMETRALRGAGQEAFSLNADAQVYQGTFLERKIDRRRQKAVNRKKVAKDGDTTVKNKEFKPKKKDIKAAEVRVSRMTNREFIAKQMNRSARKVGITNTEQLNRIQSVLMENSSRYANTNRMLQSGKRGLKGMLNLNPVRNTLVQESLQEDAAAKYLSKADNIVSSGVSLYHAYNMIAESTVIRRQAVLARKLNELDLELNNIELDPLQKSKVEHQQSKLKRKQQKNGIKKEKIEKKQSKAKQKEEAKKASRAKIKHAVRENGHTVKTGIITKIEKIPGGKRVVRIASKTGHTVAAPFKAFSSAMGFVAEKLNMAFGSIIQYMLIPIITFTAHVFLAIFVMSCGMAVIMAAIMIVESFFSTENPSVDDAAARSSSMKIVYDELQLQEAKWANNLVSLVDGISVNIKELNYADIDENTGNPVEGRENMSAADYIQDVLGLRYNPETDTVETPQPWEGAPDHACHTANGLITGGTEIRFIGTGGYPGYTSNVMELISMASIAQSNSTYAEYGDEDLAEANSDTFIDRVSNFFGNLWKKITTIVGIVGNIANKIANVIPGYSDFMTNMASKTKARTIMAYTKPLFDASHRMSFGLSFSFLPTDRALSLEGAENLNQFQQNTWYGEGGGINGTLNEISKSMVANEVWAYLTSHGFDDIHAAGVMGNFYQESRMDPNKMEYPGQRKGGIGLGQWTGLTPRNSRRLRLENYAQRLTGSDLGWMDNVKLQMDFMLLLDEPKTVMNYLRTTFPDPGAAAYWWGTKWERFNLSDGSMNRTRIPAANSYYKLYTESDDFILDSSSGDSAGSSGTSGSQTNYTEKVQYVHSDNISDDGIAEKNYNNRLRETKTVTIPGATSLTVDLWYSIENNHDWLVVRSKDEGIVTDWVKEKHSGIGKRYTGGEFDEKPSDDSEYHVTLTVEGDTASFNFYTDHSVGYYGYYAKVTGKVINTDWLDDEIAGSGNHALILNNVHTCPGNNGHGCQSFSEFSYNDQTRNYLYYEGNRIQNVYPAALDYELSGLKACNVPSGKAEDFYEALDANEGCWEVTEGSYMQSDGCLDNDNEYSDRGSSFINNNYATEGYGYKTTGTPHQFVVQVLKDVSHDHNEEDDDCSYEIQEYIFTHKCQGNHTGYYCGGHIRLLVYGIVSHMTRDQRANQHERYTPPADIHPYYKNYKVMDMPELLIDKDKVTVAKDLFEIDHAIYHVDKAVDPDFHGWTYDNIDAATVPLLTDWKELYGIQTTWTINGINGASIGGGADVTFISDIDASRIIDSITDQLPHDTTDRVRVNAIKTALHYVGKISYDQNYHGTPLREGGKNDCSGFVSRVYYNVIHKILNTDSFVSWAKSYGAYRSFSDGNCKPGDILLSGMGNATRSDNHALLYVGNVDGEIKSVDCSNRGGNGNVYYANRGSSYYSKCTYIDMETAIRGYLLLHPELAGDIFSVETENTETSENIENKN